MSQPANADARLAAPRLIATVLLPFGAGYLMSYLYRSINAVVAPDLVRDIGLDAAELGLLTAAYLFTFACFQLPLGMLLDRYGPRRTQFVLFLCAAAGSLLFAAAASTWTLTLARGLIGLGFAGGLMAGFKAVVLWVPNERRALANACIMSLGGLGILLATVPVEIAVQAFGWRMVFVGAAGMTLAVGIAILLIVPERPADGTAAPEPLKRQFAGVLHVFSNATFWRMAPLVATTSGGHIAIQTLWAGPWLRDVAGLTREGVALYLMMTAIAFLIGILFTGAAADRLARKGISNLDVMVGLLVLFLFSQLGLTLGWTGFTIPLLILFGMFGQAAILAYPWLASHFGTSLSGRAHTGMNLLIFLAAFAIQYLMGEIIDLYPQGADGTYQPESYRMAFGLSLALQAASLVWYMMKRPRG